MEETGWNKVGNDEALSAIPLEKRQHWLTPAMIFGWLEFTIPVLMVGATLVGAFGLSSIFWSDFPKPFPCLIWIVLIEPAI